MQKCKELQQENEVLTRQSSSSTQPASSSAIASLTAEKQREALLMQKCKELQQENEVLTRQLQGALTDRDEAARHSCNLEGFLEKMKIQLESRQLQWREAMQELEQVKTRQREHQQIWLNERENHTNELERLKREMQKLSISIEERDHIIQESEKALQQMSLGREIEKRQWKEKEDSLNDTIHRTIKEVEKLSYLKENEVFKKFLDENIVRIQSELALKNQQLAQAQDTIDALIQEKERRERSAKYLEAQNSSLKSQLENNSTMMDQLQGGMKELQCEVELERKLAQSLQQKIKRIMFHVYPHLIRSNSYDHHVGPSRQDLFRTNKARHTRSVDGANINVDSKNVSVEMQGLTSVTQTNIGHLARTFADLETRTASNSLDVTSPRFRLKLLRDEIMALNQRKIELVGRIQKEPKVEASTESKAHEEKKPWFMHVLGSLRHLVFFS